jgi:hypothetical protein
VNFFLGHEDCRWNWNWVLLGLVRSAPICKRIGFCCSSEAAEEEVMCMYVCVFLLLWVFAFLLQFEFAVLDPAGGGELDINVYNDRNSGAGRRSSFLGRVAIPLSTVQNHHQPNEFVRWYPLQKRGLFSNIKGDLGYPTNPPINKK